LRLLLGALRATLLALRESLFALPARLGALRVLLEALRESLLVLRDRLFALRSRLGTALIAGFALKALLRRPTRYPISGRGVVKTVCGESGRPGSPRNAGFSAIGSP